MMEKATTGGQARVFRVNTWLGNSSLRNTCKAYYPATSCVVTGLTNDQAVSFTAQAQNGKSYAANSPKSTPFTPTGSLAMGATAPLPPTQADSTSGINLNIVAPSQGDAPLTYTVVTSPSGGTCVVTGLTAA